MTHSDIIARICAAAPVIPVLTIDRVEDAQPLARALVAGGLPALEITLRTDAALEAIAAIAEVEGAMPGVGTLLTALQVKNAKAAGATFGVSPGSTLAKKAVEINFPFLPGVSSSSDIMKLLDLGYKCFKFFPAEAAGGIKYINSLRGPFPDIMFCPTGGINQTNAIEWLNLTNVICVGGSWIAPKALVAAGAWDEITQLRPSRR